MANFSGWHFRHGPVATSVAAATLLALTTPSLAADWTGATSNNWFNAGNWAGGVPTNVTNTNIDTITPNATVVGTAGAQAAALRVGASATGALTIQSGGTLSNTNGVIGNNAGSTGTVIVDGAGSTWTNSGTLDIGSHGNGTLTIRNGAAVVASTTGFIGNWPGGSGTVMIDGIGSTLTVKDIYIGWDGQATLNISNGAKLITNTVGSSLAATGISAITVDGIGSSWTNGTHMYIGDVGVGALTIRNGAAVSTSTMFLADKAGSTGTLNIGAAVGQAAVAPGTLSATSVKLGIGNGQIVFNHTGTNYTFAPVIIGSGAGTRSVLVEAGTTILTAASTYTGPTLINGGTLAVNGSIASSAVTVNAGGTLGGNGTVGNTTINGGTLAPGNSIGPLTVNGSLSLTAAASYMVEVSPANADHVNVTGTATLGGATVNASFAAGSYVAKKYNILNATGGLGGSTFGSINTNLPQGFKSSLSYDATNAYLNLALNIVPPPGSRLNGNQQAVADTLVRYFNSNGGIPLVYGALTAPGLTQASGEIATAAHPAMVQAMTQFMNGITDISAADRRLRGPASTGFAAEDDVMNAYVAVRLRGTNGEAFNLKTKAVPPVPAFEPYWRVWASGFGGGQTTDGNAVTGSSTATSRVFGVTAGADYRLSPSTVAGFALAGGGTNFSVAAGGSGRTDMFQAGAFVKHMAGSAYVTAAAAYGWHDVTTDRTVTIAGIDQLRARLAADTFAGRVEGGNRYVAPWFGGLGVTPYAAAQVIATRLPGYAETVVSGANSFALCYTAKNATASRTELGLRSDKSFALNDAILTLRGRAAWAHDYNPLTAASATLQALPGASFVVNGAAGAHDAALTTASAEIKWLNGVSLAATLEGEFSAVTRSYAGKSVASYRW